MLHNIPNSHSQSINASSHTQNSICALSSQILIILAHHPLLMSVGDCPHIMIIVFMRVNHFIYTMYNIYTHSLTDSLLLTETLTLTL
jgi:hypothetical protein